MALELNYWKNVGKEDDFDCLKTVRLKSKNEIQSLSLPHNRPKDTDQITVNRSDKQSHYFHIIWDKSNPDFYDLDYSGRGFK